MVLASVQVKKASSSYSAHHPRVSATFGSELNRNVAAGRECRIDGKYDTLRLLDGQSTYADTRNAGDSTRTDDS